MHNRDENKLKKIKLIRKARLGWETGKTIFDCNGLEKGRAG
jgi:hypothetical protein